MIPFPVSKSFLRRDLLAKRLEEEYGLAGTTCQLITATLRDVYLVTSSQGRHIFYIYQHEKRSPDEISAEWQFVDYLYSSGLPVAPPVRKSPGEYLVSFLAPEGIRYGVLTQFAPGVTLRRRPTPEAIHAYGQIVARIHTLSDQMPFTVNRPALDFHGMIQESVAAFEKEVLDRPRDLAYLRKAAEVLESSLEKLRKEKPLFGMIHGDVIRGNALVTDDGRVTVLDFDFCGAGWRAYDVASYLLTIRNKPQEQEFAEAFLAGYEEIRELAQERELLPLFEAVRAIYSIGVPAMNIEHWGKEYFDAYVDHDLTALEESMRKIG